LKGSGSSVVPNSLLLICIAGDTTGFGHLSRCLTLPDHAVSRDWLVEFWVFGDNRSQERIVNSGYKCRLLSIEDNMMSEIRDSNVSQESWVASAVITDLAHPAFMSKQEDASLWFQHIRTLAESLIVIDSVGDQSMAIRFPNMPADFLVIPYVCSDTPPEGTYYVLNGPQYAVLSRDYRDLPHFRVQRNEADRILVTCGGSDPKNFTSVILEGLERIPRPLDIHVVVGPLFREEMKMYLIQQEKQSKHNITILGAPESLADQMLWCDLAISSSGLTKYELAATGTPAMLLSIDEFHDEVNRPFAALGSVCDLGVHVTPERIYNEAYYLLNDCSKREEMSFAGKAIVDGMGAERIFTEIENESEG